MSGSTVIQNGIVITLGEECAVYNPGALRLEDGVIAAVGPVDEISTEGAEVIDAAGKVVLPGLINAHTHLYGTLARGLPLSGPPPKTFREILETLWWRFDKLLDTDSIRLNAQVAMLEAVRCGVTTLVDHHSSPNEIPGSLDTIADAALEAGVRVAAAYEVSDRDGLPGRDSAIEENRRFAGRLARNPEPLLGATIGAHASFTLSDDTLMRLVSLREECGRPIHMHMDEGREDGDAARGASSRSTARRLADRGVLRAGTVLAHAVHVDTADITLLAEREVFVTHQVLSNGGNAVGRSPVPALLRGGVKVCLGSDGMCGSLAVEALAAGAVHRMAEKDMTIPFDLPCRLAWEGNAALAATLFDPPPGVLREGFAGDAVIIDYSPPTPLDSRNVAAHWLLGILHAPVERVIIAGNQVYNKGEFARMNRESILRTSHEFTERLWRRF